MILVYFMYQPRSSLDDELRRFNGYDFNVTHIKAAIDKGFDYMAIARYHSEKTKGDTSSVAMIVNFIISQADLKSAFDAQNQKKIDANNAKLAITDEMSDDIYKKVSNRLEKQFTRSRAFMNQLGEKYGDMLNMPDDARFDSRSVQAFTDAARLRAMAVVTDPRAMIQDVYIAQKVYRESIETEALAKQGADSSGQFIFQFQSEKDEQAAAFVDDTAAGAADLAVRKGLPVDAQYAFKPNQPEAA